MDNLCNIKGYRSYPLRWLLISDFNLLSFDPGPETCVWTEGLKKKATKNFFFFTKLSMNIGRRWYSTIGSNSGNIQPIVVYNNSLLSFDPGPDPWVWTEGEKAKILKDNLGRAAIYR